MSAPAEAGTAFCLYSTTKLTALALDANASHTTATKAPATPRSVEPLPLLPRIEPPSHRSVRRPGRDKTTRTTSEGRPRHPELAPALDELVASQTPSATPAGGTAIGCQ